jgi:hypothetical protein
LGYTAVYTLVLNLVIAVVRTLLLNAPREKRPDQAAVGYHT